MLLWAVMAVMTGAAVLAVLWPLSRRDGALAPAGDDDLLFYRDQLREIERECERGRLAPADAESAKAEAGGRLLRARAARPADDAVTGEPALRRRRAASAIALSVVPMIGLAVYGALGSPRLPSIPAQTAARGDADDPLARMEAYLAAHPQDGKGWDLLAPVYLRTGRFDAAAKAYGAALRLLGDTSDRLSGYGEALVGSGGGVVSAEAAAAFHKVLGLDPRSARAGFYLALAAEQDGDLPAARAGYRRLLDMAPPDAPWTPIVRQRLAGLDAPATPPPDLAASPEIQGMVASLDARLAAQGGSEAEWARLVRSFAVLGRRDEAAERLGRARNALADRPGAGGRLDALARDLGIDVAEARP